MARSYIKTRWSYETDSWVDVISVDFSLLAARNF